MVYGTPSVDADAEGLGVEDADAGFYRQVARGSGSHEDGVADLCGGFKVVERVVDGSAHVHAAEADFHVQAAQYDTGPGGGGNAVFVVSFRILVVGIPAVGHGAEFRGEAEGVDAFAGGKTKGCIGRGNGCFVGRGKGPLQGNGLLGIGKQGNKQEGKQKGRGAENTYAPAVCWCRRRSRAVSRQQEYGFRRMPSVGYVTSALRIQMQFSFGAAVCIRNTGA